MLPRAIKPALVKSLFAGICIVFIYHFALIFADKADPFYLFSGDTTGSGYSRIIEYDTARHFIQDYPIFGIGIPTVGDSIFQLYTRSSSTYSSTDIGIIGIWGDLGLAGVILFLVCCYLAFFPRLLAESCGQGVKVCYPQVRSRAPSGIGKGCETPIFSSWLWV